MYKVLIFENQIYDIENRFKFINITAFKKQLEFKYYQSSQELEDLKELNSYDLIIIDLDLSLKSEKDGYAIISDIKEYKENLLKKVFILTGHTKVDEKLKKLHLENIPVLYKPFELEEVTSLMKKILYKK